jgi:hypothetical protein
MSINISKNKNKKIIINSKNKNRPPMKTTMVAIWASTMTKT